MAKICKEQCFIPGGPSFKKGEIITDEELLAQIGSSASFEEYDLKSEGNNTPAEKGDE